MTVAVHLKRIITIESRIYKKLATKEVLIVPKEGIEPSLSKEHDFESCASTNSATLAFEYRKNI